MRACVFVLCCVGGFISSVSAYRGGVLDNSHKVLSDVLPLVYRAGEKNVDIVVLSSPVSESTEDYDEVVKILSQASKKAGLYLVAHLMEKTACQKKREMVRSNLVFDRKGSVVAVYRKPTSSSANCTVPEGPVTFETDFGANFDLMMAEDLVLKTPRSASVVVAGVWRSEIPFLSGAQFTASWAHSWGANVLSKEGIFAGKSGVRAAAGDLAVADLEETAGDEPSIPPVIYPASISSFPVEDLDQYIFRPLNLEAAVHGVTESVCHNNFCCEFHVKTRLIGSDQDVNYGLAAFDGIRHYGGAQFIGTQNCAVFACAGLYKKSCSIGSISNNTNVVFEKLTITAGFVADNSIQYPMIVSSENVPAKNFKFETQMNKTSKQTIIEVYNIKNLFAFGIVGRDFENDFVKPLENQDGGMLDNITEDLQELFDYLWIRVRILLFIVSIYFLEMM